MTELDHLTVIHDPKKLNRAKWLEFVDSHPHGTVFQRPEMCDVFSATRRDRPAFSAVIRPDGIPAGLLLGVEQRSVGGILGAFTSRIVVWGGPIVANNDKRVLALLLDAHAKGPGRRTVYTQFRHLWDMSPARASFDNAGYTYEDHLDVLVHLEADVDVMWKRLKHFRQKNVKRAQRGGLTFREIDTVEDLHRAHEFIRQLYSRIRLPLPHSSFFDAIAGVLRPAGLARYFGAYHEGRLTAARIVLAHREWLYDYWAGVDEEKSPAEAAPALVWEVLRWGARNGFRLFDFGGAGKPHVAYGVRDFKLAYGGELVSFGRHTRVHRPWMYQGGSVAIRLLRATARGRRVSSADNG